MDFDGFDWDHGNRHKIRKHGLTEDSVEWLFHQDFMVTPDVRRSHKEERFIAIGETPERRFAFVAFTIRRKDGMTLIRPITGRYMHEKEIKIYEQKRK